MGIEIKSSSLQGGVQFTVSTIPEPGTISLLACAVVAGWLRRAWRRR